jgi:hypothetical protein
METTDPAWTLISQERKDGTWYVKAEKPETPTQHIGDFQSEAEAQDWIIQKSGSYFGKRGNP